MSFSFLYPLLWLGAAGVAVPIWLHLRQRFQSNVLRFSAVRFLDHEPVLRRSPLQLRDLLLLLLRALALVCLVAAFAWPYRPIEQPPIITESRVYVLDNTLSHQALGGFDSSRQQLLDELAAAPPETQLAVVELSSDPRVLVGFGDSRPVAEKKIQDLEPSFQRGSYLSAFRQAQILLKQSLGQRKRVLFHGDHQRNQWGEHRNSPPFLEDTDLVLHEAAQPEAPNLALTLPRWQRTQVGDRTMVDLAFDLLHLGPAESAELRLTVNGTELLAREVDLREQPELFTLAHRWEADPSVWVRGAVSLKGAPDSLAADDRLYFSIPPVEEGSVLLLAQSPYLRTALAPEVMKGRWRARVLEPGQLRVEERDRQEWDLLCVESDYLQSAAVRELMLRHLSQGRGVLLLVQRITPLVHGLLRELGFSPRQPSSAASGATELRYVFAEHPIFRPFLSPDFGNLSQIRVHRYEKLTAPQALPLVYSEQGDPILFQAAAARGRLIVSAFGLDRSDTNWTTDPSFVPFLDLCLSFARAEGTMPTNYEPGEACQVELPKETDYQELILFDGERELVRAPVRDRKAQFPMPAVLGQFTLRAAGNPTILRVLNVNPPALESDLRYGQEPGLVDTWVLRSESGPSDMPQTEDRADAMSREQILEQRVWWWALLAGILILAAETLWLTARKERP